ncbi:PREDICTED: uncharacterized protein LOC104589667 [Nelumbo nucifera]|uniref:Uncharacterized protein LOC104589667 n=2 Tax=Nelumbo nucifera TaxID=4432 RepID=A0A1U7ZFR0_NELNU|nr:PREDICTED: uncharacterized protein LOC104589667 [Nelumbo nucifera]DAD29214.1 TPA_asm: hypothetical protein HUJ06_030681 [Nelumbo nucifera]
MAEVSCEEVVQVATMVGCPNLGVSVESTQSTGDVVPLAAIITVPVAGGRVKKIAPRVWRKEPKASGLRMEVEDEYPNFIGPRFIDDRISCDEVSFASVSASVTVSPIIKRFAAELSALYPETVEGSALGNDVDAVPSLVEVSDEKHVREGDESVNDSVTEAMKPTDASEEAVVVGDFAEVDAPGLVQG